MTPLYTDAEARVFDSFVRTHANGEQTYVAILGAGEDRYVAVAYDVDPGELQPTDADCVAYGPTLNGVAERARRWMESNPKGVLGTADGSNGIVARLVGALRRLNDYGNDQLDDMQENQQ